MKAVILAGGQGTRISEETMALPKPMVQVGGKPILWHIMKIYSAYGINDFIICCGYKSYVIKEYFSNYFLHLSDVTFDLAKNEMKVHQNYAEPWRVTLVDTGERTMTGGRLRRVKDYLKDETFCMTYGDGVGNVDIKAALDFHKSSHSIATVTAVQPPGRFGSLVIEGDRVTRFDEKPPGDSAWINGGFFVLEPKVIDFVLSDETIWESQTLKTLAENEQLNTFKHHGFWQPLDTLRDKNYLEDLWQSEKAPWKIWK